MEISNRKASKGKSHPRVPIETYRWEDVRRSRKRGGYPWTYLYKQPLGDDMDIPSSTKRTETEQQRESSEWEELMLEEAENIEDIRVLSDTPRHLKNSSSSLGVSGSLLDDKNQTPGIFFLDSAESSDDISQYLDRDDPLNVAERDAVETQVPKEPRDTTSEDTQKRIRTISQGSNHSKMSLSRSVMMKKLKDAKAKIKVPKLSIPTSKFRKTVPKKSSSPPKTQSSSHDKKANKEVTPVYIHIPLKPPPGETDEYSDLDSKGGSKKSQPKKLRSFKDAVKGIKHLYGDQKEIATINEEVTEDTSKRTSEDDRLPLTEDNIVEIQPETPEDIKNEKSDVNGPMVDGTDGSSEKINAKINDVGEPQIQREKESRNQEKSNEEVLDQCGNHDMESPLHDDITENDDESELLDAYTVQEDSSKQYNDMFDDLFKASTSVMKDDKEPRDRSMRSKSAEPERKRKMSLESAYSRKSLSKLGLLKKLKNASDKIKKAFSKPNLKQEKGETAVVATKKHKENKKDAPTAPVYIYIPLKDENVDVEAKAPDEDTDDLSKPETDSKTSGSGKVELIILTAPSDDEVLDYNSSDVPETPSSENKLFFGTKITELKELAKGAIDELSAKDKQKLRTVEEEKTVDTTPVEIDSTPSGPDEVELIMVTVPTDDELLDYDSSDVPETPTESKLVFELKELAKGAIATTRPVIIDKIMNSSRVIPPDPKKRSSVGPTSQVEEPEISVKEPVQSTSDLVVVSTLVDEQDGSNETKVTMLFKKADDEEESSKAVEDKVDSTLEVQTLSTPTEDTPHSDDRFGSPKLKKKVSFRKKARLMRDGSYEDVEIPQGSFEEKPAGVPLVAQDEVETEAAKLPLEGEKDNKWSKTSDHEYEPVNPPPEDFVMIPCSTMSHTSKTVTFPMDRPTEDRSYRQSPERQAYPDSDDLDRTPTPEPETERKSSMQRFQSEFKRKAQDLRGRFHAIKKPHISLPARPVFHTPNFKIDKSKFSFLHVKNKFPSLKQTAKRHHSTESNDGDAKRTIFSTYPRIFKRKPTEYCEDTSDFATVPRSRTKQKPSDWSGGEPVRIPLHSEDSMEESYVKGESLEELGTPRIEYPEHEDFGYNGESMGRWDRGTFSSEHQSQIVTDLDTPEEQPDVQSEYKERYSSGSSNGLHRQGVLEEIDSDEFFLRQKGISQDNIEVGMYLSSEIRDAFRTPANALSQMQHPEYDMKGSAHSIPEVSAKRKPMKKPKRKKTPHVSQERIDSNEAESAEEDEEGVIPPRPKRNSRRCSRKQKSPQDNLIPYQETISVEGPHDRMSEHRESLAVWGDDERDEEVIAYEDEGMVMKEQPDISVNDEVDGPVVPPRKQKSLKSLNFSENDSILGRDISDDGIPKLEAIRTESKVIIPIPAEVPERPTRSKSRSRMSLQYGKETHSENENAFAKTTYRNIPFADDVEQTFEKIMNDSHNYVGEPVTLSRKTIESAGGGNEKFFEKIIEPSLTKSDVAFTKISQQQEPCLEEICKEDIRDCMGYAVVDKSKSRDPPLPPPRIPKRRKKPAKNGNNRFATIQGSTFHEKSPIRPLRNYSTLGQMRKQNQSNDNYEDEENIDITQYIEIDDATKKLQSGDVVQKMKDRPLPAPPRPPRKARPLHDISSEENIMIRHTSPYAEETEVSTQTEPLPDDFVCEEMVQEPTDTVIIPTERHKKRTELLPDDLVPNEVIQQLTETISAPTERRKKLTDPSKEIENVEKIHERQVDLLPDNSVIQEPSESTRRKREIQLITPTVFTYEETITHGSLLVEPLDGAEIFPNQNERRIQVHVESDEEETSSIPEDFNNLSSPAEKPVIIKESSEIDSAQPVQLKSLDIETLKVNRLLADKIVVSELDAGMIRTNDISSESGSVQVTGLNLPPELIKEMILAIKSDRVEDHEAIITKVSEQTVEEVDNENVSSVGDVIHYELGGTSIGHATSDEEDNRIQEEMSGCSRDLQQDYCTGDSITGATCDKQSEPLREQTEDNEQSNALREIISEVDDAAPPSVEGNYPPRPPRQAERIKSQHLREEPEVDDEPPPRPPEPQVTYLPSQPPASFYALRAERYVESVSDSIPLAPRRRRHIKAKHLSRSSSDESSTAALQRRRSHRRSSSPSLTELSSTLLRVCGSEINVALRRLVTYVLTNVRRNDDGKQDLNVMMIVVLVMIAGLILLGYGEEKTVVHLHHWDYFNPPTNM